MKFWRGNRVDAEFELPAVEVADQFMAWFDSQLGADELRADAPLLQTGLEKLIRFWMTGHDHFNSVWEAENRTVFGDESFDGIYDTVYHEIFVKSGKRRHVGG